MQTKSEENILYFSLLDPNINMNSEEVTKQLWIVGNYFEF